MGDPRRARASRPASRRGPSVGRRLARGVAATLGGPRSLHRAGCGQGRRGLPRRTPVAQSGAGMTSARVERLVDLLPECGVDLMLVTHGVNVRYLTGYTGSNGIALIGPSLRLF